MPIDRAPTRKSARPSVAALALAVTTLLPAWAHAVAPIEAHAAGQFRCAKDGLCLFAEGARDLFGAFRAGQDEILFDLHEADAPGAAMEAPDVYRTDGAVADGSGQLLTSYAHSPERAALYAGLPVYDAAADAAEKYQKGWAWCSAHEALVRDFTAAMHEVDNDVPEAKEKALDGRAHAWRMALILADNVWHNCLVAKQRVGQALTMATSFDTTP